MHVDHAQARDGEQRVWKEPPVGCYHAEIRSRVTHGSKEGLVPQTLRLQNRDSVRERHFLGSCVDEVLPASFRPIRLRHDQRHGVPGGEQSLERRHCERWRTEVGDAQRRRGHHFPVRLSFWILRTIMSRLIPRSRSMNTMPSR